MGNFIKNYILDGHKAVPCNDIISWAEAFESQDRVVAKTTKGLVEVSTVFLGIDHSFGGKPLLFETMIFGGKRNGEIHKYSTWEEAEKSHEEICKTLKV